MNSPRFLALFLAVSIVGGGVFVADSAALANGCIDHSATADGTDAHPFIISMPAELTCLKDNAADYWGVGLHFRQTADINMTGTSWASPIGTYSTPFFGHFDGGDHSITNFVYSSEHSGDYFQGDGLFGNVASSARVANTHLVNASIRVIGTQWGSANIGTLAGLVQGQISRSSATGSVVINQVGTVAGVGGLVGGVERGGSLTNVASSVNVSVSTTLNQNRGSRVELIGGLVGQIYLAHVAGAQSRGSVELHCPDLVQSVGGLAGDLMNGSVTNSFSLTSLSITAPWDSSQVGGLVGLLGGGSIFSSFAAGTMTATGAGHFDRAGGLVGTAQAESSVVSTVSNSIFDRNTLGQDLPTIGSANPGTIEIGAARLQTNEMKTFTTYSTTAFIAAPWDIFNGYASSASQVWGICDGLNYPFLRTLATTDPCALPAFDPVVSLSAASSVAGGTANVTAAGFPANTEIRIELRSTPVTLARVTSDADGAFTASVIIPASTPLGDHNIVFVNVLTSADLASTPIFVTSLPPAPADGAITLASTGANTAAPLAGGVILLLLGLTVLVLLWRRGRGTK